MFDWMKKNANPDHTSFSVDEGVQPDTSMASPDAIKTENALSALGFEGKNKQGAFSLPNNVKDFQDTHGLKVDGVINPGGPTENAISNAIEQHGHNNELPPHVSVTKTGEKSYQASASFGPNETRSHAQQQPVSKGQWDQENPERTWDPDAEAEFRKEYAQDHPEPKVERLSYQEMQSLLERDPEAFDRLPQADRSAYHAYMTKKHSSLTVGQKPHERDEQERNATIAGREAGAGSYIGEAITQPFLEADVQATLALEMLGGEEPDYKAFDEKMKTIRDRIPVGYQSARGIGQAQDFGKGVIKAGSMLPPFAPVASLQTAGETASDLAKAGVPLNGQRIGAALTGMSSMFGKGMTKGALRKVNDMLVKRFGTDLRRMTPQQLKVIGDTVLGEAWSIGPKGITMDIYQGDDVVK